MLSLNAAEEGEEMKKMSRDYEVTFEIKERIGVINERPDNWNKEVNIMSWNGGTPKYDIRDWDENHERMTRGITLTEDEMKALVALVTKRMEEKDGKDSRD